MRRIELLPESYRQQQRQRRTIAFIVMAGLLVVLLLTIWFVRLNFQISNEKDELQTVQAENQTLRNQIAQLQTFQDLKNEVDQKRLALETVMTGDLDWPVLMTEVAMAVPGEVWLRSMTASAGDTEGSTPAPTETAPIDVSAKRSVGRIVFEGSSLSMPGVAKWLIRQQLSDTFEAVYLSDAVETVIAGQSAFDFESSLELNQQAFSRRFLDDLTDGQP
jgi:Tfp pilus assembly protein PilN